MDEAAADVQLQKKIEPENGRAALRNKKEIPAKKTVENRQKLCYNATWKHKSRETCPETGMHPASILAY